jgi:hypothetical protein
MSNSTGTLPQSASPLRRRLAAVALTTVALAVFAGCSGGSTPAAQPAGDYTEPVVATDVTTSTTPAATSTSTDASRRSTPTSTPTTTRPANRLTSGSRLRLDGIGAVEIGMTLEQASAATGMNVRITSQDFGTDCRYAEADGGPEGLAFMVISGRIVRIDVTREPVGSPITTLSGVGVGDTHDQVQAAYPGRIDVRPNAYSENGRDLVYRASDPALSLIFVTEGGRVNSFRSGQAGPVSAIEGCL